MTRATRRAYPSVIRAEAEAAGLYVWNTSSKRNGVYGTLTIARVIPGIPRHACSLYQTHIEDSETLYRNGYMLSVSATQRARAFIARASGLR